MVITLDFDEILFPLMDPFLAWVRKNYHAGLKLKVEDVSDYDLTPWFSTQRIHDLLEEFYFSAAMQLIVPEEGAVVGVNELLRAGYELIVVTGRPDFCSKKTEEQLARRFPILRVMYTNQFYKDRTQASKRDICRSVGSRLHIDDMVKHVNDCSRSGIKSIFMRRKWKCFTPLHENVRVVDNWKQLMELILPAQVV